MIKKLAFLLLGATLFLNSCTETPFVPNTSNDLMVGQWNIDEVDNADAFVSATEMMSSILNEKFLPTNIFVFDKGAEFHLLDTKNEIVFKGEYAIGAENKSLSLKIDGIVYEYDLISNGESTFAVNSATAGETVKLVISKK
ncbi:MAG: hypothetical protein ACJA0Q_001934 [Saprospiraceae bacterium]|jgi:hypothetical protein